MLLNYENTKIIYILCKWKNKLNYYVQGIIKTMVDTYFYG